MRRNLLVKFRSLSSGQSIESDSDPSAEEKRRRIEKEIEAEEARKKGIMKKIELIMGKTKIRLKLARENDDSKFNKHFESLKQLKTFVDSSKLISQTNVLNNQDLLRQIEQYQFRQHLKRLVGDQTSLLLDVNKDPLYQELDFEEDREKPDGNPQFQLLFGHITEVETKPKPTIRVDDYMTAKAAIKRAADPIRKRYSSLPALEDEYGTEGAQNTLNQLQSNFEDNLFYQRIQNNLHHYEKKIIYSQINKERDRLDKEKRQHIDDIKLAELAKSFGIDIDGEQKGSTKKEQTKEKIYQMFRKRSQAVIHHAVEEARQKHNQIQNEADTDATVKQGKAKYSKVVEQKIREWKIKRRPKILTYAESLPRLEEFQLKDNQIKQPQSLVNSYISTTHRSISQRTAPRQSIIGIPDTQAKLAYMKLRSYQNELGEITKEQRNAFENQFKKMEDDIEQLMDRQDFHRQLKTLEFSEQERLQQRVVRFDNAGGQLQKMAKKSHNRAMKLMRYSD